MNAEKAKQSTFFIRELSLESTNSSRLIMNYVHDK